MDSSRALKLAQQAYDSSTTYIDANFRSDWEYSIRAFRNEHALGSKYLSEEYKARSRLFYPKTRTIIRKNEAAGAVALFSNADVVNLEPGNPDNPENVASTQVLKALLEYRLNKSIPTFQLVMGGLQDAQTQGAVVSYQYWEYQKKKGKRVKDKPCVDLIPIENVRFDPGASWLDPVNTSPYWCHVIPMYVCDVVGLMESEDEKTGLKFKKFEKDVIAQARSSEIDRTSQARRGNQQDPTDEAKEISDFETVHVMRWFMRDSQGDDWVYYTLGDKEVLVEPQPLEKVYFHGIRPYVMGYAVLETHKSVKSSMPMLVKSLQLEANDVTNQRLDNVKLVLNKRYYVARGRMVDTQSLLRNVAGGVTLVTDPKTDIIEANWPDVTQSSYVEHDRINSAFDDLAGNFSPSTKVANNAVNDTLGGSRMANMSAGLMSDYLLRTFIETWWEPVLKQLILLERYYEDDHLIIRLCAEKARLFPRFGPEYLSNLIEVYESDVKVNVGMGASDPNQRLQKFLFAIKAAMEILAFPGRGINKLESIKEIFSMVGYRDGARFIEQQVDPTVANLMQMLQRLQAMVEGKQQELQFQGQLEQAKIQSAERQKAAQLHVDQQRVAGEQQLKWAQLELDKAKLDLEGIRVRLDANNMDEEHQVKLVELNTKLEEQQLKLQGEREKQANDQILAAQDMQKTQMEMEAAQAQIEGAQSQKNAEKQSNEVAQQVSQSMQAINKQIQDLARVVADAQKENEGMKQGMVMMGQMMNQPKRKVKGVKKRKDGKTLKAIEVEYDDGTTEEVSVN